MKKILAVLLLMLVAFSVVACKDDNEGATTTNYSFNFDVSDDDGGLDTIFTFDPNKDYQFPDEEV